MTFDLISGLHIQIQTWHPPLWLCTHAKYYVKSGLTNVLKNANKTKNMHLFSIRIANYIVAEHGYLHHSIRTSIQRVFTIHYMSEHDKLCVHVTSTVSVLYESL